MDKTPARRVWGPEFGSPHCSPPRISALIKHTQGTPAQPTLLVHLIGKPFIQLKNNASVNKVEDNVETPNASSGFCTHVHIYHTHMYPHACKHAHTHTYTHTTYRHVQEINIKYNFNLKSLAIIIIFRVYKAMRNLCWFYYTTKNMSVTAESLDDHCSRPSVEKTKRNEYFSY